MAEDDALPPAVDPWIGVASPVAPAGTGTREWETNEPPVVVERVVYVEQRRRRRWPWVLGALGVLTVVCCGFAVAATADIRAQYPAHVTIGNQVAGLRRDNGLAATLGSAAVVAAIDNQQHIGGGFAAALEDPTSPNQPVMLAGATEFIWDPGGSLDGVIHSAAPGTLRHVTSYPPGHLGGVVRCADGQDGSGKAVVYCAWIDHGSVGLGIFYGGRPMAHCANLLREIRAAVLTRG